jgi:hypothetical protein
MIDDQTKTINGGPYHRKRESYSKKIGKIKIDKNIFDDYTITNKKTIKAIRDTITKKNLGHYNSIDELIKDKKSRFRLW